jgi:hypothetical protein
MKDGFQKKVFSLLQKKYAIFGISVMALSVAAIALGTHRSRIDSDLSNDATYLAARDAVAHMNHSGPCEALAHTMLAYASDRTLPQQTRDAQVYYAMNKAKKYCM